MVKDDAPQTKEELKSTEQQPKKDKDATFNIDGLLGRQLLNLLRLLGILPTDLKDVPLTPKHEKPEETKETAKEKGHDAEKDGGKTPVNQSANDEKSAELPSDSEPRPGFTASGQKLSFTDIIAHLIVLFVSESPEMRRQALLNLESSLNAVHEKGLKDTGKDFQADDEMTLPENKAPQKEEKKPEKEKSVQPEKESVSLEELSDKSALKRANKPPIKKLESKEAPVLQPKGGLVK